VRNQDISVISTNNQNSEEFIFNSNIQEKTDSKSNIDNSNINDVKKILIMEENSHFTEKDR